MTDTPDDPNQQTLTAWNDPDSAPNQHPDTTDHPETPHEQADEPHDTTTDADATTHGTDTETDADAPATSTTDDQTPGAESATLVDIARDDLTIDTEHALTERAVATLVGDETPSPPLADTVHDLATQEPELTTTESRIARACYILARAQTGALPGYSLDDSMVRLRDRIEAELNLSFDTLLDNEVVAEKRVLGKYKYYRLTAHARATLHKVEHPHPGVLDDDIPILRDGPVHNRAVLAGSEWLTTNTRVSRVEKPHLATDRPVDLAGYHDGQRSWLGEVVGAEDDFDAVCARLELLRDTDAKVLLVVENSRVAVTLFERLHANGVLDIPPDITYRNFSIAQLRTHVLPELDDAPFDRVTALTTLLRPE